MFDIPNCETVDKRLEKHFSDIRYARRKVDHKDYIQLRASSFPICPRAYVIYRRSPVRKRPSREQSFISDSATTLGTALHLALQKWFGIHGRLYGNWVCVHCKKIRRHKAGIQTCKECGREMMYHEYEIRPTENSPFSGHIDGILVPPPPILIDFKGSNLQALRDLKNDGKPKESHYLQTNAYANVVNQHLSDYGLSQPIEKIIIIYVDRGKPWQTWLPMQVPVSRKIHREVIGRIHLAQECLQTGKIPKGLCARPSDPYAKYCPWATICFSPAIDGLLSKDVEPEGRPEEIPQQNLMLMASYLEQH